MKILVFGSDKSILDINSQAAKRALDYSLLADKYIVLVPSDHNTKVCHTDRLEIYGISSFGRLWGLVKAYSLGSQLIKKEKFDVITTPDAYYLALVGWLLAKKYKLGLEVQIHGFERLRGLRYSIAKFILPRATAVRVVSERLKKMMINTFKVDGDRITVVPVYSPPYQGGADAFADKKKGKFIFLTVSRLVSIKNIPLQLLALKELIKSQPQAELWIVGDGPERNKIIKKINQLGLNSHVKMLGYKNRQELDVIYRSADVFVLTSFAEGWPITVMEAARYGLPILMTDVGSAGELIINKKSGLVVPVNDSVALAAAMRSLSIDSILCRDIGQGALAAVNAMPDKGKILELYKAGWSKAIKNKRKSKLLILTQKVDQNDPILGFFHGWIELFAKEFEQVTVICLYLGQYDLPGNVKVLSLGKEQKPGRLRYLLNFYRYIWQERRNYDWVFIHMNPIYSVLGFIFWKIQNKKIAFWYTHKKVSRLLILAEKLVDVIFSASAESFRLPTKKLVITGHGINIDKFSPGAKVRNDDKLVILSAGRISESKKIKELVFLAEELNKRKLNFVFKIAGCPIFETDKTYLTEVKKIIAENKLQAYFDFIGPIPNNQMPNFLNQGDIFINLSTTGSVDKAILEAMACGINVITSNEAFKNILPADNFCEGSDPLLLADKIISLSQKDNSRPFRDYVKNNHELSLLINKISNIIKKL